MKREIITTLDGSTTIHLPDWNESYHSKYGAIQEAYHVFIKNGLSLFKDNSISVLEIGFGTGLNAFITFLEANKNNLLIDYTAVEAYPVTVEEAMKMNYLKELDAQKFDYLFKDMHTSNWGEKLVLNEHFNFIKQKLFFQDIESQNEFDLIYFDAFGYRVQPELWSTAIFQKMYNALKYKGILVTYAARGVVKRSMQEVGFTVKKIAGPPGKREMMVAYKNI